jgi:hypothetical protein
MTITCVYEKTQIFIWKGPHGKENVANKLEKNTWTGPYQNEPFEKSIWKIYTEMTRKRGQEHMERSIWRVGKYGEARKSTCEK